MRLRAHFRELRRPNAKSFIFRVQGLSETTVVGSLRVGWAGESDYDPQGTLSRTVPPGVTSRIDYESNDVYIDIPELFASEWRVRTSFQATATGPDDGYVSSWVDDAYGGYQKSLATSYGTYGPWVMRPKPDW